MTRATTFGVLVFALMLVTIGAAGFAGAAAPSSSDAGDVTAAASAAPLAQDTTEEENETANETTTAEMGNESETDDEPEVDPNATASVTFDDQPSNGSAVVVNETNLSDGGFLVILDDGGTMIGNSSYLEPGTHENVTVELNTTLNESGVLVVEPHQDTNDNETFDYNATLAAEIGAENATDGPYLENDVPVGSTAYVTVGEETTNRSMDVPKIDPFW
jgi:hypothetical protein